jgi:hypothetical protein
LYFSVSNKCQPWTISGANASKSCVGKAGNAGYDCTFTCNTGYYFSNEVNTGSIVVSCFNNNDWNRKPPSCSGNLSNWIVPPPHPSCSGNLSNWIEVPPPPRHVQVICQTLSSQIIYNGFGFMVFNTSFNNISVILWRSVLLVEETWVPGENHRPAASHWQTLSHNVVSPEWDSNSQC